ncbi:MAG: hypothetical protein AAFS13_04050 [Pseudomonadota bacterium]
MFLKLFKRKPGGIEFDFVGVIRPFVDQPTAKKGKRSVLNLMLEDL